MNKLFPFFIASLCLVGLNLQAKTYYIATNGHDSNPGTKHAPFASIMHAQDVVVPGDTVLLRDGTYEMHANEISTYQKGYAIMFNLNKSGKSGKMIHYMAYPGEDVVFNMQDVTPPNYRIMVFNVTGSWIHLKGFEVTGTQVTITKHTQSECFHNEGSNNIYELLSMHDGQAIGFYLINGSNNLILNCDAYRNWDYTSENGKGGNTDGFGCHPRLGGKNNVFRGCRAWFNSDDGYDCIRAAEAVTFDHCWAFNNGYNKIFESLGDGNGFKAGGWGLVKDDRVPAKIPMHTVEFCLAVNNKASGFYANHQPGGGYWYNNSAYHNSINFNMLGRDVNFTKDIPGMGHVLKNNISLDARGEDTKWIDKEICTLVDNTFDSDITVKKSDFESLDENQLTAPRNDDGSLPDITFMHLKPKSSLIDKGVDIGFPYKGNAPDLGAFEEK